MSHRVHCPRNILAFVLILVGGMLLPHSANAQRNRASAAKPPHVTAPKPPQMHFTAPKPPQMHPTAPKNPQKPFRAPGAPPLRFKPPTFTSKQGHAPKLGSAKVGPSKRPHAAVRQAKAPHPNATPAPASTTASAVRPTVVFVPVSSAYGYGGSYLGYRGHGRYYGRPSYYFRPRYYRIRQATGVNPALRNLQQLIADLDALRPKTAVTQVHRSILRTDLIAVAERSRRPDPALVQPLADHLADALTRRKMPLLDTADLAWNLKAVMNSTHLNPMQSQQAITQAETLLKAGRVSQLDLQMVSRDMRAIASQPPLARIQ
jgi:hypothetical protein